MRTGLANPALPRGLHALLLAATIACASAARADRIPIVSGTDWSAQAARAKPGDELVLMPGIHRPAVLEGLHGTKEAPIVVTSSASDLLAEIATPGVALRIVDSSHLRIERLLVRDAAETAIVVDAGPGGGCREIAIASLLVLDGRTPARAPEGAAGAPQRGVVVRGAEGVTIERSRIEGASATGVLIERTRRIALRDLQVVATSARPMRDGIALGAGVEDVEIARTTASGRLATAIVVGPVAQDPSTAPTADAAAARTIRIEDSNVRGCERALELGSCDDVRIERLSVADAGVEILRIAPAAGGAARGVRIAASAFTWTPGRLRRLVGGVPPADPSGIELGENLWYSRELPLAFPALGPAGNPYVVRMAAAQRTDLDPRLDDLGRPENPDAAAFGRTSDYRKE